MHRRSILVLVTCLLAFFGVSVHSQTTIRGLVQEDSTSLAVHGAEIILIDTLGNSVGMVITDRDGRFEMSPPAGRYSFQALRMGFAPTVTPELAVPENGPTINLTILLPTERVVLDPVVISGERQPFAPGPLRGFYERKRRGWGIQIAREEIEERAPGQVTDIFRNLPGVRVTGGGQNGATVQMVGQTPRLDATAYSSFDIIRAMGNPGAQSEGAISRAGACPVTYYIDGIKFVPGPGGINGEIGVSEIEAVEVYRRASETPADFLDSDSRCGVVVIWTKRGGGEEPK